MKLLFLLLTITFFAGCQQIKFANDVGFINSAQANSYEFPIKINGNFCKDLNGQQGLCSLHQKQRQDIKLNFLKLPYSYSFKLICKMDADMGIDEEISVPSNTDFEYIIDWEKFDRSRNGNCIGVIKPDDRPQPVWVKFRFFFMVVMKDYEARENPYSWNNYLIMGKYSKYVYTDKKLYRKKPILKNPKVKWAFSESELGRWNSYGI